MRSSLSALMKSIHWLRARRLECVLLLIGSMSLAAFGQEQATVVTIPNVPATKLVAVGDLNGDGRADLALVDAPPLKASSQAPTFHLHFFFQKQGTFSMPADRTFALGDTSPSGLAVGDFDADGRADIVVALRTARSLCLFLASEHFEKEHRHKYGNDTGAGGLSVGRVNKTGLADFFTGAAWRQWQGRERFGEAYFAGPKRNDNWRATLADMDRDGIDDVIFTTYWTGKLTVPENNLIRIHYGPFLKMFIVQPADSAGVVTLNSPFTDSDKPLLGQVLTGDLNDDDQQDLVVPAPGQTLVYLQNSPTGFSENADPTFIVRDATPLLVTDLDGDKRCDIAFQPLNQSSIAIWLQRPDKPLTSKSLAECRRINVPRMSSVAVSHDINGDGQSEMLVPLTGGGLAIVSLPKAAK